MIIIVAVEKNNGLLFNDRRVSRDRVLREKIVSITAGKRLWMNAYTARQFGAALPENARVDEGFLAKAQPGEFCFVENKAILPYVNRIETIYLFRWNRDYPSDVKLDLDPAANGLSPTSSEELEGSSHEKITVEVWEKGSADSGMREMS